MPKKVTTRTYTTPKRIVEVDGNKYIVTKTTLRQLTKSHAYSLTLADLFDSSLNLVPSVSYALGRKKFRELDGSPFTAEVVYRPVGVFDQTSHQLNIGCQYFTGKNATAILSRAKKAARIRNAATKAATKKLAKAAAAGV